MEQANFAALVDAIVYASLQGHPLAKEQIAVLGNTSELLQKHGAPELALGIKGSTIEKVVMDHGIPKSMLKRLPNLLATPLALYRSATSQKDGVVVLTFEVTHLGAVIVPIAFNQTIGRNRTMNLVSSMYAKEDRNVFKRWDAANLKIWSST